MASWLVRSTPDREVRVQALTEDIVLCSWSRHFTLAAVASRAPSRCTCILNGYRQIVTETKQNCGEVTCDGLASHPGEVEILPAASCYKNRNKLCSYDPALAPSKLVSAVDHSTQLQTIFREDLDTHTVNYMTDASSL